MRPVVLLVGRLPDVIRTVAKELEDLARILGDAKQAGTEFRLEIS